jgi:hypothetical protein
MRHIKVPLIGVLFVFLAGCANGFFSVAETPAQKAYGIERSYNIVLEDALEIASASSTSANVRESIQRAEATSTPVIDSLSDALAAYEVERAKVDTGVSTAELLAVVAANLENWIAEAQRALISLQSAF